MLKSVLPRQSSSPRDKQHLSASRAMAQLSTYIDVTLLVALVQVEQDGSFVQVSQHGHVLYPIDAALVHRQDFFYGKGGLGVLEHLEEQE